MQQLTWRDAVIAWLVAWVGAFLLAVVLIPITRRGPLPTLPAYAVHAWLFAVAMFWFLALRRKFPVGTVRWGELRPWAWSWLVVIALLLAALIGLAIGLLYDRFPNLWGASIPHDVIDGLQAVIRYL